MSDKTEALLQELVDIHKREAKRAQTHRWLRFAFGTLPAFAIVIFSIWGGYILLEQATAFIENAPEIIEGNISDLIPQLPAGVGSDLLR